MTDPALVPVVRAYHSKVLAVREATSARVAAAWDLYGGPSEAEMEAFAQQAARIVEAGQRRVASITDGYLSAYLRRAGVDASPLGLEVDLEGLRNGTTAAEVYARPVVTTRAALAQGRSLSQALAAGRNRAETSAETDVMLAHRDAASQVFHAYRDQIAGFERVLSGGSCALCAIASTQRYRTSELMPIHDRCDCGVVAIVKGSSDDVGQIINRDRYDALKADGSIDRISSARAEARARSGDGTPDLAAADQTAPFSNLLADLDSAIATHTHGELGPVLAVAGHHFTGPSDL